MSFIDFTKREIYCRVAYWGPGLSGKTTNLQHIHGRAFPGAARIEPPQTIESAPYLSFVLPASEEVHSGFRLRVMLCANTGVIQHDTPRKRILHQVDGVVFVADSRSSCLAANHELFEMLRAELSFDGRSLEGLPLVVQYNKRDLEDALPLSDIRAALNPTRASDVEAIATSGTGVMETLQSIQGQLIDLLRKSKASA